MGQENNAAAVKNAVWVSPTAAESVLSSCSMVVRAGLKVFQREEKALGLADDAVE